MPLKMVDSIERRFIEIGTLSNEPALNGNGGSDTF